MLNKEIANYITYINHKPQSLKKKTRLLPYPHLETQFGFDELLRITNSPGETGGVGCRWPQFFEPGGSWIN